MKYSTLLFLFIIFPAFDALSAEEEVKINNLTLEKARELAVSSSAPLKKASMEMDKAQLDKAALKYNWFPGISFSGNYKISDNGISTDTSTSAGISLQQQIWDGGVYSVRKKIEQNNIDKSFYEWESTLSEVINKTDILFHNYNETVLKELSARAALEASGLLLESSLSRYESGIISKASYLQARADSAAKETELLAAESYRKTAEKELASFLHLDRLPPLAPVEADIFGKYVGAVTKAQSTAGVSIPEKLLEESLKNGVSLKTAAAALKSAELDKLLKIKGYNPVFSVSAGNTYTSVNESEFSSSKSITFSGTVSVSMWDIGNTVKSADTEIESARLSLGETEREYLLKTETAWSDLISSAHEAKASELAYEFAREYYSEIHERYMLSAESISSLKDAEADMIKAETNWITARFTFLKNLSSMVYITGTGNEAALLEIMAGI